MGRHLKENMCKEEEHPISIYRAQLRRAARNYFFNDYFFLSEAVKIFAIVVVIMDIAGTVADTSKIIGGKRKVISNVIRS